MSPTLAPAAVTEPAPPSLDPADDAEAFAALLAQVERDHGFRVGSYKPRCLRRRVAVRMRATGAHTYAQYARALAADPREYERLLDALTIHVTRLFRDPEAWAALDALVVAPRAAAGRPLRAWSAGCATGEEAYSLAAVMHARYADAPGGSAPPDVRVLGTDVDAACLGLAAGGTVAAAAAAEAPPAWRSRYFAATGDGPAVRVAPALRAVVDFARHDLLRDPPPDGPWDLIACRNVVIYFDRASQDALFERFHAALAPDGVLFLGKVETLLGPLRSRFTPVDTRHRLFRRA